MEEREKLLLRRIYGYLAPKGLVNAVYISPAQHLRNAADELEQKEKDLAEFRKLIDL